MRWGTETRPAPRPGPGFPRSRERRWGSRRFEGGLGGGAPLLAPLGSCLRRNDACGRPPSSALRTGFDRLRATDLGGASVKGSRGCDGGGDASLPRPTGPAAPRSPFDFPRGERPPRAAGWGRRHGGAPPPPPPSPHGFAGFMPCRNDAWREAPFECPQQLLWMARGWGFQGVWWRTMALRMVRSLCMQATSATFLGLPWANSRS